MIMMMSLTFAVQKCEFNLMYLCKEFITQDMSEFISYLILYAYVPIIPNIKSIY